MENEDKKDPSHSSDAKSVVESFATQFSVGKYFYSLFSREKKALKDGGLAVLVIAGAGFVAGILLVWQFEKSRTQALEGKVDNLQTRLDIAQSALAPWKSLALQQYPGQSDQAALNGLLKSFNALARAVESEMVPAQQPFNTAVAQVRLLTLQKGTKDTWDSYDEYAPDYMGGGDPVKNAPYRISFLNQDGAVLALGSYGMRYAPNDDEHAEISFMANILSPRSGFIGKSLSELNLCDGIEIDMGTSTLPDSMPIVGGNVTVLINKGIRLVFEVPSQFPHGGKLYMGNIEKGLAPLYVGGESSH